jgi:pantoate kinase
MTPEGKVKAKVKAWLKENGIWFCMPMGTGFGNSGVPDFVCCWNGKFLAIETKAPGRLNNTTAMQDAQIAAIRAAAGIALVVDDVSMLDTLKEKENANTSK